MHQLSPHGGINPLICTISRPPELLKPIHRQASILELPTGHQALCWRKRLGIFLPEAQCWEGGAELPTAAITRHYKLGGLE